MPINRGLDKADVVHIYNATLLNHKKEWNCIICRNVDGPRDCHTEWSKSERENQVWDMNTYMWNLEKWYRWSYLQNRNRETDVEDKHMDIKRGRGSEMNWEIKIDIYTLLILCIKYITNKNLLYSTGNSTWCSVVTRMKRKSKKEGTDVYV